MITGFNTDIEFQGTIYHVQTEDKGLATPLILSLVYHRGTILASKRSPYDDLLKNFDEKVLAERLQKQHRLICAAIRAGRIEELKRMTAKESAEKQKIPAFADAPAPIVAAALNRNFSAVTPERSVKNDLKKTAEPAVKQSDDKPKPAAENVFETPPIPKPADAVFFGLPEVKKEPEIIIESVEIIEEETVLPDDAVAVVFDPIMSIPPLTGKLKIEILDADVFKSGERKMISIYVCRVDARNYPVEANVMVKIIGSAFRPLVFHSKADRTGVAKVDLQMPQFSRGRAVLLVKAMSGGDEAELRRVIKHQ